MKRKMNTHKLVKIRLLKPIPGHKAGRVIARRRPHAEKLIQMKIAVPEVKEEKAVIETKEEKFAPEVTKGEDFVLETDESSSPATTTWGVEETHSVRQLAEIVSELPDDTLLDIMKYDDRVTAVKIASDEIKRREA